MNIENKYLETVIPILKKAGDLARPGFGNAGKTVMKTNSAPDIVTEYDKKIEIFLQNELQIPFPDTTFYGEEFGGDDNSDKFWLVDPIDGTGHFVRGIPLCTTMITLIENEEPVFSAIYNFMTEEMYVAEKGRGAYKNGKAIHVSSRSLKDGYFSVETDIRKSYENTKRLEWLHKNFIVINIITGGFEFGLIAEGKTDGYFAYNPFGRIHDFAPGALLILEAGGVVRNIGSERYNYRDLNFVATNTTVYKELEDIQIEGDVAFTVV